MTSYNPRELILKALANPEITDKDLMKMVSVVQHLIFNTSSECKKSGLEAQNPYLSHSSASTKARC